MGEEQFLYKEKKTTEIKTFSEEQEYKEKKNKDSKRARYEEWRRMNEALKANKNKKADTDNQADSTEGGTYVRFNELYQMYDGDFSYSPEAVRRLTDLKLFDILLGSYNRSTDSIAAKVEKDANDNIKIVDIKISKEKGQYTRSIFDDMLTRGFLALDDSTKNRIMTIDDESIEYLYADVMTVEDMETMTGKLHEIKALIQHDRDADVKIDYTKGVYMKYEAWNGSHALKFADKDIDYLTLPVTSMDYMTYLKLLFEDISEPDDAFESVEDAADYITKIKSRTWGTANENEKSMLIDHQIRIIDQEGMSEDLEAGRARKLNKKRLLQSNDDMINNIDEVLLSNFDSLNSNRKEIMTIYRKILKIYDCEKKLKGLLSRNSKNAEFKRQLQYLDDYAMKLEDKLSVKLGS